MRELLNIPEIPDEEKILYWMREAKEAKAALWQLEIKAQAAVAAYESRFESIHGRYNGPIDDEMRELNETIWQMQGELVLITASNGRTAKIRQGAVDSAKQLHGVDLVAEIKAQLEE